MLSLGFRSQLYLFAEEKESHDNLREGYLLKHAIYTYDCGCAAADC